MDGQFTKIICDQVFGRHCEDHCPLAKVCNEKYNYFSKQATIEHDMKMENAASEFFKDLEEDINVPFDVI